jgi:signal transduction histidine kinase
MMTASRQKLAWLRADGELFVRAFVNLLSNGVRYSAAGSRIWLRVSLEGERVLCQFLDEGYGMTAEQIDILLHGHESLAGLSERNQPDEARCMGVGFVMARTVISRHGGTIDIESQEGVGTTVSVRLPLLLADLVDE